MKMEIYSEGGDFSGVRRVTLPGSDIVCYDAPRKSVRDFRDLEYADRAAVYHLIGSDAESLYIGETDVLKNRVLMQDRQKSFDWSRIVAFTSSGDYFTKAHALYIEFYLTERAKEANRVHIVSGGKRESNLSPGDKEISEKFAGDVMAMMPVIGFDFYKVPDSSESKNLLYCKKERTDNADAVGVYQDDGSFLILKDSLLEKKVAAGSVGASFTRERERRLASGDIVEEGDSYRVVRDITLRSPSGASGFVLGRWSSMGWTDWKDKDGKTLGELYPDR